MPQDSQPAFIDSSPSLKMIDGLIMRGASGMSPVRALNADAFTAHSSQGRWTATSSSGDDAARKRLASLAIGAVVALSVVGIAAWALLASDSSAALPAIDRWISSLGTR